MRRGGAIAFLLLLLPTVAMAQNGTTEEGWRPLFNGTDLSGWSGSTDGYVARDGALVALADGGGNLYADGEFSDFVLRFSFRMEEGGNNGVGIRAVRGEDAAYHGMEIQILDDHAPRYAELQPWQYHGSIYGVVAARRGSLRPAGEWNDQEIHVEGSRVRVTVNGQVIVAADIREAARDGTLDGRDHPGLFNQAGAIGFLGHGSQVEFRDIRILDLGSPADPVAK